MTDQLFRTFPAALWRVYPPNTNNGDARERLERAGFRIGGFDHTLRAFVACEAPRTMASAGMRGFKFESYLPNGSRE